MEGLMEFLKLFVILLPIVLVLSAIVPASAGIKIRDRFTSGVYRFGSEVGALIYDLVDPQELQGFVRGIQQEQEKNRFVLSQFLPNNNIDDIEWRVTRGQLRDQDAAVVRAWDVEAPIGNRQGISRIMGELPPISKKIRLGEEERLRKRKLETGSTAALEAAIYNDAGNMARAVVSRVEMFRGEALETGSIVINENGVNQPIDFGRLASHEVTLAGAAMWSDPAAPVVQQMQAWVTTYRDTNGIEPALILTSARQIGFLLLNNQIRTLLGTVNGAPALVTQAQLTAVLQAFGLPPLVPYDVVVRVEGVATRVIRDNVAILMPPANEPLGATFFGTTAEALELQEAQQILADQAPGLVSVVDKTFDPVATWTKAAAIALPVLVNPDLTFVATVSA